MTPAEREALDAKFAEFEEQKRQLWIEVNGAETLYLVGNKYKKPSN